MPVGFIETKVPFDDDLEGRRGEKLAWLDATPSESVPWKPLAPADVLHYERILRALDLTADLMAEIDGV